MTSYRDDDYAHDLTAHERETLNTLVKHIQTPLPVRGRPLAPETGPPEATSTARRRPLGPETGPPEVTSTARRRPLGPETEPPDGTSTVRRRRLVPVAAAAAVLVGLSGLFVLRPEPSPPPVTAPTSTPAPAEVLDSLATAAGRQTTATGGYLHRDDTVLVVTGIPANCVITAVSVRTWTPAGSPAAPVTGHLTVALAKPPAATAAEAGCGPGAEITAARTLFDGETTDAAARWAQLPLPAGLPYPGPRTVSTTFNLGGRIPATEKKLTLAIGKLCVNAATTDCSALRWTALTGILTSPESTPPERALALRLAATIPGTTVLPHHSGVTLRVPHESGTADLTFDPSTGDLLQTTTRTTDGTRSDTTLHGTHTRTATTRP
ncbi:hypothetical protein [Actinoplanes couchii]|uniref:Uncharacterized protein n=1 Tax=Actinoplanes couchii TaxID=403638 RepID=A0ABQ3XPJ8_9ACTN|nr:hypothetical protein [Actinoplanes couchii]GID60409.1 hypothetical protein Aco03nite_088130 [Actinoplanes couchii]